MSLHFLFFLFFYSSLYEKFHYTLVQTMHGKIKSPGGHLKCEALPPSAVFTPPDYSTCLFFPMCSSKLKLKLDFSNGNLHILRTNTVCLWSLQIPCMWFINVQSCIFTFTLWTSLSNDHNSYGAFPSAHKPPWFVKVFFNHFSQSCRALLVPPPLVPGCNYGNKAELFPP